MFHHQILRFTPFLFPTVPYDHLNNHQFHLSPIPNGGPLAGSYVASTKLGFIPKVSHFLVSYHLVADCPHMRCAVWCIKGTAHRGSYHRLRTSRTSSRIGGRFIVPSPVLPTECVLQRIPFLDSGVEDARDVNRHLAVLPPMQCENHLVMAAHVDPHFTLKFRRAPLARDLLTNLFRPSLDANLKYKRLVVLQNPPTHLIPEFATTGLRRGSSIRPPNNNDNTEAAKYGGDIAIT